MPRFRLTPAVQEALLAILCYDDAPQGARMIMALVPAKSMDPFYKEIGLEVEAYIAKWRKPPGTHTLDIIDQLKERHQGKAEGYEEIYKSIRRCAQSKPNRGYMMDRAREWARWQGMRTVGTGIVSGVEKGTLKGLEEAEAAYTKGAKTVSELFEPGVFLNDTDAVMRALDEEEECEFPTGIRELDRRGLCPGRRRLFLMAGTAKFGKTWFLLHLAKHSFMRGKRVLYVSLEMGQDVFLRRCIQTFFACTKREAKQLHRAYFKTNEDGRFVELETRGLGRRPALKNAEDRATIRAFLTRLQHKPRFLIKKFPTRSITVKDLDGYLDALEATTGFIPDHLLVDYPKIMHLDAKNLRTSLGVCMEDLRGLADRRNLAVSAVHQLNRAGSGKSTPDVQDMGEDWSVVQTADTLVIGARTDDEKELGLARLFVGVGREDADRFSVLLAQNYDIGQFALQSVGMTPDYWDHVKAAKDGGAPEDVGDADEFA